MTQVKTVIKIPDEYSARAAKTIANDILDFIVERTKSGEGKDGKPFPKYSKEYKESLDFKIAGKDNTVDLTLTGELLDSLTVLKVSKGEIVIGYKAGDHVNGKAEGNILGSYGGEPDSSKARNFLDVSKREVAGILKEYPLKKFKERMDNISTAELARLLAKDIAANVEFDNGSE